MRGCHSYLRINSWWSPQICEPTTVSTPSLLVTAGKSRILTALQTKHARLCGLLGRERKRKECGCIFWSLFSGLFVHFLLTVTGRKTNNSIKRDEIFSSEESLGTLSIEFCPVAILHEHFAFSRALQLHDLSERLLPTLNNLAHSLGRPEMRILILLG